MWRGMVARHKGFWPWGRSLGSPGEVPGGTALEDLREALGEAPLELRAQITGLKANLGGSCPADFPAACPDPPVEHFRVPFFYLY